MTRSTSERVMAADRAPEGRATKKVATSKKATTKKATTQKAATETAGVKATAAAKKTATKKTATKKTAAKKTAAASRTPASGGASETSGAPRKKAAAEKNVPKTPASAPDPSGGDAPKPAPRTSNLRNSKKWFGPSSGEPKAADTKPPKYLTDKKWLESQRLLLLDERAKYTHNAELLAAEAQSLMADREPGDVQFDEESGEGDTLAVERDRDLALSAQARETVADIDAALARLENGTYGICIASGEYIPQERLEALPMAAKTVQAQTSIF